MRATPLSLYIHIPFCTLKCSYCDFNSYARLEELIPAFTEAICAETRLWGKLLPGRSVDTLFFGGGTPSLMPLDRLEQIMSAVRDSFRVDAGTEMTLEANPGTVDREYLRGLLALGVNRISFGVQSFHDDELAALDRIHSAEEARRCYRWAREAGFRRISLDLIYGLPEQPVLRWQSSLREAIALAPEHLSLYALTVEEGTKLAHDIERGVAPGPDPDLQAEMYEWSRRELADAGYGQYEISNWCRPGEECRHNLVYWRNGEWLGLGPGAHSHLRTDGNEVSGYRFADVYSPRQYVQSVRETVEQGVPAEGDMASLLQSMRQVAFVEAQSPQREMSDTAILSLRLNEGLSVGEFSRQFGQAPEVAYGEALAEMISLGLLERANGDAQGERLRLTDRGRYLASEVFVRLLPE